MTALLRRIRNILLKPRQEWQVIREERTTERQVLLGYGALMAAVPPCAAVLERVLFGGRIAGSRSIGFVLVTNLVWYVVILVNIVITAVVLTTIVTSSEHRRMEPQGMQLAAYSFTPLFLVSVLMIVPRLDRLIYAAILYSVYLLYLGIGTLTSAGKGRAAWLAAASFLAVAVIVGILNGMEYMLESYVMGKLFG